MFDLLVPLMEVYRDLILIMALMYAFLVFQKYRRKSEMKEISIIRKKTLDFCLNDSIEYSLFSNSWSNIKNTATEKKNIYKIFLHFEKISKAVKLGEFDEDVIREYYESYFYVYYNYFLLDLKESNEDSDIPFFFIEYEKLLKKWSLDSDKSRRRQF